VVLVVSVIEALHGYANNELLSGLSTNELERLLPHFKSIPLLPDTRPFLAAREPISHVYFPTSGLVSIMGKSNGSSTGIAVVGSDGMIGVSLVLRTEVMPFEVVVQIPGEALMMSAEVFKTELKQGGKFEDRLLKYSNTVLDQIGQSLICNHFHAIEARFCSELLVSSDRVGSDTLVLTHESISHMLGAPRTAITKVANDLRDAGFIRYRRGKITIANRAEIERLACECYKLCKVDHVAVNAQVVPAPQIVCHGQCQHRTL
jgi:CRP-like cAMP-binding protein